jgi:hypothetical protein
MRIVPRVLGFHINPEEGEESLTQVTVDRV